MLKISFLIWKEVPFGKCYSVLQNGVYNFHDDVMVRFVPDVIIFFDCRKPIVNNSR